MNDLNENQRNDMKNGESTLVKTDTAKTALTPSGCSECPPRRGVWRCGEVWEGRAPTRDPRPILSPLSTPKPNSIYISTFFLLTWDMMGLRTEEQVPG